jgi:nucleoside-diphosphate-sugar epimerase
VLGYEPTVDWEAGLRRTIAWISESRDVLEQAVA